MRRRHTGKNVSRPTSFWKVWIAEDLPISFVARLPTRTAYFVQLAKLIEFVLLVLPVSGISACG